MGKCLLLEVHGSIVIIGFGGVNIKIGGYGRFAVATIAMAMTENTPNINVM